MSEIEEREKEYRRKRKEERYRYRGIDPECPIAYIDDRQLIKIITWFIEDDGTGKGKHGQPLKRKHIPLTNKQISQVTYWTFPRYVCVKNISRMRVWLRKKKEQETETDCL